MEANITNLIAALAVSDKQICVHEIEKNCHYIVIFKGADGQELTRDVVDTLSQAMREVVIFSKVELTVGYTEDRYASLYNTVGDGVLTVYGDL